MPQGLRERFGRAAMFGLGVVVCSGLVGCTNTDPGPRKSAGQLPTKTGTVQPGGAQWPNTPPAPLGSNTPNRPGGPAQPGAAVGGVQPGATQFGQAQPGHPGSIGTPVRQGSNPATMSPTSPGASNSIVPPVAPPGPGGVQPAGGVTPGTPMSYNSGNTFQPARTVSPEPVVLTAGYHNESKSQPLIEPPPMPPAPRPEPTPAVSPTQPVAPPTASGAPAFPTGAQSSPYSPMAPIAP